MPDALVCRDCANHPIFPVVPGWDDNNALLPERLSRGTAARRARLRRDAPSSALEALDDGEAAWARLYREATQYEVCEWCGTNLWALGDPRDIFVIEWPSSYEHDDDDDDDIQAVVVPGVTLPVQHEARAECDDCESPLPYGTEPCPNCGGHVRQIDAWVSGTEPLPTPTLPPARTAGEAIASAMNTMADAIRRAPTSTITGGRLLNLGLNGEIRAERAPLAWTWEDDPPLMATPRATTDL